MALVTICGFWNICFEGVLRLGVEVEEDGWYNANTQRAIWLLKSLMLQSQPKKRFGVILLSQRGIMLRLVENFSLQVRGVVVVARILGCSKPVALFSTTASGLVILTNRPKSREANKFDTVFRIWLEEKGNLRRPRRAVMLF